MSIGRFLRRLFRKKSRSALDVAIQIEDAEALINSIVPDARARRLGFVDAFRVARAKWDSKIVWGGAASLGAFFLTMYFAELIINLLVPMNPLVFLPGPDHVVANHVFGSILLFFAGVAVVEWICILMAKLMHWQKPKPRSLGTTYRFLLAFSALAAIPGFWFGPLGLLFVIPFFLLASVGAFNVLRNVGRKQAAIPPEKVRERLADHFQTLLTEHKENALGERSDFNRVRLRLERARDEAEEARRYWNERQTDEPESAEIQTSAEYAADLSCRMGEALSSLENQRETMRAFFAECEARVRRIAKGADDFVENRRLARISHEADVLAGETGAIALHAAHAFMEDIRRLHRALERLHECVLLGNARDIENLDALADRIVALESENSAAFERLEAAFYAKHLN